MTINRTEHDNYITLAPIGELDANSSIVMIETIGECIDAGKTNLHIDCKELQYISSAGVGAFISFHEKLKTSGGKFVFSGMSENIRKVFELLGLQVVFTIVGDPSEVATAF